ncbi:MOSC domain-containing protein, partial [Geobacillus sp. MMMUD3]|nr:MOSC domain-containing protein [Geobacillus sp. MMMUD3]
PARASIELIEGVGVRGDAHAGATVQHRSWLQRTPSAPNLRQVHLLHAELFAELERVGFAVGPGQLGENITTIGLDLLGLPVGTRLMIGDVVITVTGLRNPCAQIDSWQSGLLRHVVSRNGEGEVVRRAGVMGTVSRGGVIRPGDLVDVDLPTGEHRPLAPVRGGLRPSTVRPPAVTP